ncbi:hypothetical protein CLOM_g18010, partial [Closterium sp. NIES-68]
LTLSCPPFRLFRRSFRHPSAPRAHLHHKSVSHRSRQDPYCSWSLASVLPYFPFPSDHPPGESAQQKRLSILVFHRHGFSDRPARGEAPGWSPSEPDRGGMPAGDEPEQQGAGGAGARHRERVFSETRAREARKAQGPTGGAQG